MRATSRVCRGHRTNLALAALAFSEEDINAVGPKGAEAVPKLINLPADRDESVRAIACITLSHIGPAANQALPALRKALSDPSQWVRRCAHAWRSRKTQDSRLAQRSRLEAAGVGPHGDPPRGRPDNSEPMYQFFR